MSRRELIDQLSAMERQLRNVHAFRVIGDEELSENNIAVGGSHNQLYSLSKMPGLFVRYSSQKKEQKRTLRVVGNHSSFSAYDRRFLGDNPTTLIGGIPFQTTEVMKCNLRDLMTCCRLGDISIVRDTTAQIVAGLDVLHNKHRIVHHDIKLQNILVNAKIEGLNAVEPPSKPLVLMHTPSIKIIDFECETKFEPACTQQITRRGTPAFLPPEIFQSESCETSFDLYKKVDVWSFGCVLLALLVKRDEIPILSFGLEKKAFFIIYDSERYELYQLAELNLAARFDDPLEKSCWELLEWIFQYEPTERPSIEEVRAHDFFSDCSDAYLDRFVVPDYQLGFDDNESELSRCIMQLSNYLEQAGPSDQTLFTALDNGAKIAHQLSFSQQVIKTALDFVQISLKWYTFYAFPAVVDYMMNACQLELSVDGPINEVLASWEPKPFMDFQVNLTETFEELDDFNWVEKKIACWEKVHDEVDLAITLCKDVATLCEDQHDAFFEIIKTASTQQKIDAISIDLFALLEKMQSIDKFNNLSSKFSDSLLHALNEILEDIYFWQQEYNTFSVIELMNILIFFDNAIAFLAKLPNDESSSCLARVTQKIHEIDEGLRSHENINHFELKNAKSKLNRCRHFSTRLPLATFWLSQCNVDTIIQNLDMLDEVLQVVIENPEEAGELSGMLVDTLTISDINATLSYNAELLACMQSRVNTPEMEDSDLCRELASLTASTSDHKMRSPTAR